MKKVGVQSWHTYDMLTGGLAQETQIFAMCERDAGDKLTQATPSQKLVMPLFHKHEVNN